MNRLPLAQSPGLTALTIFAFAGVAYGLALAAATILLMVLRGPWRRSSGAHWTERARLAYAPGHALVWLALILPTLLAFVSDVGAGSLGASPSLSQPGFWTVWLAAFAGVMTVRYGWVRELWGPRVTIRSWLAGCLVLLVLFIPHVIVFLLLVFLMPDEPSARAAVIFGAGVLITAILVRGGGLLLLRLIGVVRAAPPSVTEMVGLLALEMKVPGKVEVLELHWPQVNAVAWVMHRTVGFSRAMLNLMREDEVRAVAAHELAHLMEPRWVKTVRIAHVFAYLPIVLLIKYGGSAGPAFGFVLAIAIPLAYRRFTRNLEKRADRVEREAIVDPAPYMRSLLSLYEANLAPAVMPGAQSHPHLYDRLLAGGIQPDFPRPRPPSRAKPLLSALAATIIAVVLMFMMVLALGVIQNLL